MFSLTIHLKQRLCNCYIGNWQIVLDHHPNRTDVLLTCKKMKR